MRFCLSMILGAAIMMVASPVIAKAVIASDDDAAFLAAFGQRWPVLRHVDRQQVVLDSKPPNQIEQDSLTMRLQPDRLILIEGSRWALIVTEHAQNVGEMEPGAIAVAYLDRSAHGWRVEHVWPEIFYDGVAGQPANAGETVYRSGSAPL